MFRSRSERSLEKARRVVPPIARKYGVIRVDLFGSRARGDCRRNSDYDFVILCPKDMGMFALASFHHELTEALGHEVDFAYERSMSDGFRERIAEDRRPVYASG